MTALAGDERSAVGRRGGDAVDKGGAGGRQMRILIFRFVVAAVILAQGCVPAPPVITGPVLPRENIEKIQPGKTKKTEILEWFGLPMAIGAKGATLTILRESAWVGEALGGKIRRGGYYQAEADTFFELFSSKHKIVEQHRVYYYYRAVSTQFGFFAALAIYETRKTRFDKLWLLINEETGVVEDYVFRAEE